jgi:hypothetical protein
MCKYKLNLYWLSICPSIRDHSHDERDIPKTRLRPEGRCSTSDRPEAPASSKRRVILKFLEHAPMHSPDVYALRKSNLNPFLFADIGLEPQGLMLQVVSLFARMGEDPWREAARLAGLTAPASGHCLLPL